MAKRQLPPPEVLRQLLRYEPETGAFYWLPRGGEWFGGKGAPAEKACIRFNRQYAGCRALHSIDDKGYCYGEILQRKLKAHRVAWAHYHGAWPSGEVDHINGDRQDNRIVNLRDVSSAENSQNIKMSTRNTSGVFGVYWNRQLQRWHARIRKNNQIHHLGYFDDIQAADAARRAAEQALGFHPNHGRIVQ